MSIGGSTSFWSSFRRAVLLSGRRARGGESGRLARRADREEAQSCDLILLARGSQFRFIAGDDEA